MRNIIIILLAVSFASCNPFISKDLREKNKCNRKITKELKRHKKKVAKIAVNCPDIITQEVIVDTIEVEIPKIKIDSFIVIQKDTAEIDSLVNLIKNKNTREIIREYVMKYIPIKDTVIHLSDGYMIKLWSYDGNIHYSVEKPLQVLKIETKTVVEIPKPIELSLWEKIMNGARSFWWITVLFIALILLIRFAWKRKP